MEQIGGDKCRGWYVFIQDIQLVDVLMVLDE